MTYYYNNNLRNDGTLLSSKLTFPSSINNWLD